MGLSFKQRPHSLNTRFNNNNANDEEEKKSAVGGPLELNATGMGRGRFAGA